MTRISATFIAIIGVFASTVVSAEPVDNAEIGKAIEAAKAVSSAIDDIAASKDTWLQRLDKDHSDIVRVQAVTRRLVRVSRDPEVAGLFANFVARTSKENRRVASIVRTDVTGLRSTAETLRVLTDLLIRVRDSGRAEP